jgi:Aspartate/ornithine carbamoyltransferase, Asp/Orn binding domain
MGQEAEYEQRIRDFAGFQVTEALCREGGAHPDWKFMHCLPRKQHEVDDEVRNAALFPQHAPLTSRFAGLLWLTLPRFPGSRQPQVDNHGFVRVRNLHFICIYHTLNGPTSLLFGKWDLSGDHRRKKLQD